MAEIQASEAEEIVLGFYDDGRVVIVDDSTGHVAMSAGAGSGKSSRAALELAAKEHRLAFIASRYTAEARTAS